ncbi:2-oxoacid:acceptor oxidoreductase family protein [Tindallia californiensis]|uniref:2-oxoglutarate ferredoxin oxidoreductase, gamma subunit n=1 Tax=Tindallia californiensis TaxID=159292 RepID=A0A1H3NM48_9FIRM|nr:2-oxoacid:acceptor oxidoreductase family protein [Tindallia californiensis]SDY89971.1 2-oxoglutarate ferredoxin oxidoreductase, gamma subunit [Tindallia californiensis]
MSKQTEIRLGGSGGQGLILGGIILAEAAILDNKNAVQAQSYGPEARGGASKAEVIISDGHIDYPKVQHADVFLALTQKACDKYLSELKMNGLLIVDDKIEINPTTYENFKIVKVPILKTALDDLKKGMVANIIAMAVIQQLTHVISKESLETAVLKRVPKGTGELNKKALLAGYNLVN